MWCHAIPGWGGGGGGGEGAVGGPEGVRLELQVCVCRWAPGPGDWTSTR